MKVKFYCNSGANAVSTRVEIVDIEDYGYTDNEWHALTDDQKYEIVEEWAWERLEIGFKEEL